MSIPPRSRGEAKVRASRSFVSREVILPAQLYIHNEIIGGALLCLAAVVALVWANSLWAESYFSFFQETISIQVWDWSISHTLKHWINDGAMVLFFFVVGLEVKREFVNGELSDPRQAILPGMAALGGMIVPALIYVGFTFHTTGEELRGWGIPMATDIAFALAVLALLGKRIPVEARIFLLTLATIDDIGAILVIAIFYTEQVSWVMIGTAILVFGFMALLRKLGVRNILMFILAGCFFWLAVLKSGIHATIAGVALGLLTPAQPWFNERNFDAAATKLLNSYREAVTRGDTNGGRALLGQFEELTLGTESLAERLERLIHPWVSFAVLPLFAFANAGITLSGEIMEQAIMSPVTLGVGIGLVIGKVSGVLGCSWMAIRVGLATMPSSLNWTSILGIGLLSGIGFTVSLFISGLAYSEGALDEQAKIGILLASIFSGFGGYMFLRLCSPGKP
jgi:Na+:H+ antiporter, NhaA family